MNIKNYAKTSVKVIVLIVVVLVVVVWVVFRLQHKKLVICEEELVVYFQARIDYEILTLDSFLAVHDAYYTADLLYQFPGLNRKDFEDVEEAFEVISEIEDDSIIIPDGNYILSGTIGAIGAIPISCKGMKQLMINIAERAGFEVNSKSDVRRLIEFIKIRPVFVAEGVGDWKIYTNDQLGFSFQYPQKWGDPRYWRAIGNFDRLINYNSKLRSPNLIDGVYLNLPNKENIVSHYGFSYSPSLESNMTTAELVTKIASVYDDVRIQNVSVGGRNAIRLEYIIRSEYRNSNIISIYMPYNTANTRENILMFSADTNLPEWDPNFHGEYSYYSSDDDYYNSDKYVITEDTFNKLINSIRFIEEE